MITSLSPSQSCVRSLTHSTEPLLLICNCLQRLNTHKNEVFEKLYPSIIRNYVLFSINLALARQTAEYSNILNATSETKNILIIFLFFFCILNLWKCHQEMS